MINSLRFSDKRLNKKSVYDILLSGDSRFPNLIRGGGLQWLAFSECFCFCIVVPRKILQVRLLPLYDTESVDWIFLE
ncbi:MAG TPA: hypothetical protein DDX91_00135 [Ruminococcaceae bacterium]|nr:hypothetical protein [Oscillospiraceae bacterium]